MRACVRACVCACVHACLHACGVRVCVMCVVCVCVCVWCVCVCGVCTHESNLCVHVYICACMFTSIVFVWFYVPMPYCVSFMYVYVQYICLCAVASCSHSCYAIFLSCAGLSLRS